MSEPTHGESSGTDHDRVVIQGAAVAYLGNIGRGLNLVFLSLLMQLYGAVVAGLFVTAQTAVDVIRNLTVSGVKDGLVMVGARDEEARLPRLAAAGLWIAAGLAAVVSVGMFIAAPALVSLAPAGEDTGAEVAVLIRMMVWSLPMFAVADVLVAATRARMMMRYEALVSGFVRFGAMILYMVPAWFVTDSLVVLGGAQLASAAAMMLVALWAYGRHYGLVPLAKAALRPPHAPGLVRFAIPQALNNTFNSFITQLDTLMLWWLGVGPALISFYKAGSTLMRMLRQVRMNFSNALAPVISRLVGRGAIDELAQRFANVVRWSSSIMFPALILILALRFPLLLLFDRTFTGDTGFIVILAAIPVASILGVAGVVVIMSGHAGWNLLNSMVIAAVNFALNWLWIPRWGLWGAAAASTVAVLALTVMQVAEARFIVGLPIRARQFYKPMLAGAAGLAATLGIEQLLPAGLGYNVLTALIGLVTFGAILAALRPGDADFRAIADALRLRRRH